jgi:cell wall-associated NlpC family hydrolase
LKVRQSQLRDAIVAEARSWVGTPYHNCADVKGVGCDCGMLLVRVFVDLGLVAPFDPRPYTHDWHLHRGEERYLDALFARAQRVASPLPGDAMLFRLGRCYSHGGVVTCPDPLTIVHASWPAQVVLEEVVTQNAMMRERLDTALYASIVEASA